MVGLVILYDHVHPVGAFARGTHMDVKGCVRLLQAQPPIRAEPLLNALRYTTKHLNEENTPRNIKSLLAAWLILLLPYLDKLDKSCGKCDYISVSLIVSALTNE